MDAWIELVARMEVVGGRVCEQRGFDDTFLRFICFLSTTTRNEKGQNKKYRI
jgi:hypothetical protein